MLYETAARAAEILALDVDDLDLPQPAGQSPPQGRRHRRHRLADRHRPPAAPPAARRRSGPVFRTDRRARVQLPPVRPRPDQRPGPAVLPAGRRTVRRRHRRRHPAPAPPQRADPRRRRRRQHRHPARLLRAHLGRLACPVRPRLARRPDPLATDPRPCPPPLSTATTRPPPSSDGPPRLHQPGTRSAPLLRGPPTGRTATGTSCPGTRATTTCSAATGRSTTSTAAPVATCSTVDPARRTVRCTRRVRRPSPSTWPIPSRCRARPARATRS